MSSSAVWSLGKLRKIISDDRGDRSVNAPVPGGSIGPENDSGGWGDVPQPAGLWVNKDGNKEGTAVMVEC